MKTTNLGMPNVYGFNIKHAVEGFWKGEKTVEDVLESEQEVSDYNASVQEDLDLAPVGDIDIYDRMLRTATRFGFTPRRFGSSERALEDIGTYLSIPRGEGNHKASPMVKWFDTNYHVIQPEIGNDPELLQSPDVPEDGSGKLALVGPWTLLSHSMNETTKSKDTLFYKLAHQYIQLINNLPEGTVVQLEEPSFLTHGIQESYNSFVRGLNKETHLHVYFGAVNEFADELFALDVDGIGLDFIDGPENLELLDRFPEDKQLIAGVINGRNVWPASTRTRDALENILTHIDEDRLYISPSCSLAHVPLDASEEDGEYNFSFALQKLEELQAIKDGTIEYIEVPENVAPLPEERFERSRTEAWSSGKPYLTTTTGSFPQTAEVRRNRAELIRGEITEEEYIDRTKDLITECVRRQDTLGLDLLVHGEFERADMVQYFADNFDGFTAIKGAVQSYGTRFVRPPVVTGEISRPEAFTVPWTEHAQTKTKKPVKAILTGPVTLSRWSFPREDISREAQFYEFADALADEVNDLAAAGIKHIQVDEPAIREGLPIQRERWDDYLFHATNSFRKVFADIPDDVVAHTHMCFSEFGDIIEAIEDMKADVYLIEDSKAKSKMANIISRRRFPASLGLGVYDVHSPIIPKAHEMAKIPKRYSEHLTPEDIQIVPDCGLKTRGEEAWSQLENMVKAAKVLRI